MASDLATCCRLAAYGDAVGECLWAGARQTARPVVCTLVTPGLDRLGPNATRIVISDRKEVDQMPGFDGTGPAGRGPMGRHM